MKIPVPPVVALDVSEHVEQTARGRGGLFHMRSSGLCCSLLIRLIMRCVLRLVRVSVGRVCVMSDGIWRLLLLAVACMRLLRPTVHSVCYVRVA